MFNWVFDNAGSEGNAKAVEKYFISHGMKSTDHKGEIKCKWVYTYLMSKTTKP